MNILEIPLEADGEVLTIDLENDLPDDPSEICVLLENENCAAPFWLAFGSAYARKNQVVNAIEVVSKGLVAPIIHSETDKAPFLASLCWLNLRAMRQAPVAEKKDAYQLAVEFANRAYQLDRTSAATVLARGALALSVGNFDDALQPFVTQLSASSDKDVYAKFGRARVLYHRKNYRSALQLYQSILRAKPRAEPDPRIGIGLCFWKLGDKQRALAAWERAAQLNPENVAANSLVGIYYLDAALHNLSTQEEFEQSYVTAINALQSAYKPDGSSGIASLGIASYLFSRQDMQNVLKLTDKVLQYATVPALVSDALFWKARVYHFVEDFDSALAAYRQALEANPANYVAAIGKGMIELVKNNAEAVFTLETVAKDHPRSADAALYCGIVYAKRGAGDPKRLSKAVAMFERYLSLKKTANEPPVPEALLYIAQLLETSKALPPTKAHEYLRDAIAELEDIPSELNNNRGVLAYFCGHHEEARAAFEAALPQASQAKQATIKFNLARIDDAAGNPEAALKGYAGVLEALPDYLPAQIRSAYLEIVAGDAHRGAELLHELMVKHDDNLEVRALEGWYLRRQKRAGVKVEDSEQNLYKHSLMDLDKHDTYSLVAMGNLYLDNARELRVSKQADAERKEKAYFKAAEFFDKALQIDPENAYAAQGVAIIFSETKRPQQALHVFGRLRETLDDISVFINSGHAYAELKQYGRAVEMYEQAISRAGPNPDASLYALLGRAWYALGASKRDPAALERALDSSRQAVKAQPQNPALKFNVAFIQFQIADLLRKLPLETRSSTQIEGAIAGLRDAIATLRDVASKANPPFAASELEQRAEFGDESVLPQLERALAEQQEFEQESSAKLEAARQMREAEQEKIAQELKRKRNEEEERERQLAEERRVLQEQAQQWELERAAEAAANGDGPERKKRKDNDFVAPDEELSDLGSDADEGFKPDDGRESDGDDKNGASRTEAEVNGEGASRRKNVVVDDDDSDDGLF